MFIHQAPLVNEMETVLATRNAGTQLPFIEEGVHRSLMSEVQSLAVINSRTSLNSPMAD